MIYFFTQILAYLIGSIPFGYIVARLKAGIDIRDYGSGNIGATNCGRILGFRFFFLVFWLDFLKGAVPVLCAQAAQTWRLLPGASEQTPLHGLEVAVGIAVILGHMFPIYLGFRGGKGVATSIGVIACLAPIPGLIGLIVWVLVVLATRMISLGSIAFAHTFAVSHFLITDRPFTLRELPMGIFVVAVAILVTVAHRKNIVRIVNGVESTVRFPRRKR